MTAARGNAAGSDPGHRRDDPRSERAAALGLPAQGPGSPAGWGVRVLALAADWALAVLLSVPLAGPRAGREFVVLAVFAVLVWLGTALTGCSLGQRLLGLRVLRLDHRPVGLWRGLVRTLLIVLVLPPLITGIDGRGLHDVAAGTVVVHGPRRTRTS